MSQEEIIDTNKGIIPWFARNSVAANLLMVVILFVGIGSALAIQRTLQPEFEINIITITVPYPGATPEEVEDGVVLKIEEALQDVEAIEDFECSVFDGCYKAGRIDEKYLNTIEAARSEGSEMRLAAAQDGASVGLHNDI